VSPPFFRSGCLAVVAPVFERDDGRGLRHLHSLSLISVPPTVVADPIIFLRLVLQFDRQDSHTTTRMERILEGQERAE
jgi:hypothetical protein